jgi:hypothetical protein
LSQAVLLGGLFIGVLSALPIINLANCCCLWILGGGAIAAYLAQQQHPGPFGLMDGARVGLRAGIFGAVIWLFASTVVDLLVAPLQQSAADLMLRSATDIPPEVREWLENIGNSASLPARMIIGFFFSCSSPLRSPRSEACSAPQCSVAPPRRRQCNHRRVSPNRRQPQANHEPSVVYANRLE